MWIRFEEEQKIEQRYHGNSTDIDELAQILRAVFFLCTMCTPVTAAILELSRLAVLLIYLSQAYGCDVQILLHVHFGDKRAILGIGCDKYSCGIGMYTSMILACTPR